MGDVVNGVERTEGILKHHLDAAPIGERPPPAAGLPAVQPDRAAVGGLQPQNDAGDRALSAPRFADQGDGLAPVHLKRDVGRRRHPLRRRE